MKIIKFLQGKKTYIVAIAAFIYGIYAKNTDAVLLALGLAGLRNSVTTEIAKVVTKKK